MNVEVRLFARARDLAGSERVAVELSETATVADLKAALAERYPPLRPLMASLHVAIGNKYADGTTRVPAGAEVACFPPVSGG